MWFARGVQSAVFYYVTCTPCATAEDRRKRRREAIRLQREQARRSAAVVTDQPRPFAQPTPFSTNDGWREEIALGPGPPVRRAGHRATKPYPSDSNTSSMTADEASPPPGKDKGGLKTPLGERLQWMRYQREDEPLWGEEDQPVPGSSVGFSGRGRADTSLSGQYYIARAPPVNDLHPPIVSGPTSRAETRWMMQPPPSARVMEGKARHDSVRASRAPSLHTKKQNERKSGGQENDDEVLEGQSRPFTERSSWLSAAKTNSTRKFADMKRPRPGPITVINDYRHEMDTAETYSDDGSPRRPALALLASRSKSVTQVRHAYDEWHLQVSSSLNSRSNSPSSLGSPVDSLNCPGTPYSRPESKRTDDSGKAFRSSTSNLTTNPLPRHPQKDIEAIHVELNEAKLRDHSQPPKWRWSFEV